MNSAWLSVCEASGNWNVSPALRLSGRAGIVEVQVPSISQGLVNTAQALAACHSLCVVDSFGKFDTLVSFLENLAGFSSPSVADPFLLTPVVRLKCEVILDLLSEQSQCISLTFKKIKTLPSWSSRNFYFSCGNGTLLFVRIMLSPIPLKVGTNFLKHLLYQQTIHRKAGFGQLFVQLTHVSRALERVSTEHTECFLVRWKGWFVRGVGLLQYLAFSLSPLVFISRLQVLGAHSCPCP